MVCFCCQSQMDCASTPSSFMEYSCKACGLEHYRAAERAELPAYADDADYISDLRSGGRYQDLLQWHHRIALRLARRHFSHPASTRCLDYGAFSGFFVRSLLEEGFDAVGCELNSSAVEFGLRNYNLGSRLITHEEWSTRRQDKRYNLITLFEVLEHVPEPADLVVQLRDRLESGGLIMVSTPNKAMLWRPPLDYPPHHLSRFSHTSLRNLLAASGLQVLHTYEQMSVFDLSRHYIGSKFRNAAKRSMRGGRHRGGRMVAFAKCAANRFRPALHILCRPVDSLLHHLGYRYISQLFIAGKG